MACYRPQAAFRSPNGGPLAFHQYRNYTAIQIRCGKCIGCYIDDSRDWAARCMHEAKQHKHNCFLTLTYDNEHIPSSYNLEHRDYQLFIKKLREAIQRQERKASPPRPSGGEGGGGEQTTNTILYTAATAPEKRLARQPLQVLRYHMCGEYGPTTGRPHYHANLFGINFADRKECEKSETGHVMYESETLTQIWGNGRITIGDLTWETAAYTARYNMKKAGDKNKKIVEIIDVETGEVIKRIAEYQRMSRNPGIGKGWIKKYTTDVYPHGTIIVAGGEVTPPRYYDDYYKTLDPEGYERLKSDRQAAQSKRESKGLTRSRLDAEETVATAKLHFLKRNGDKQ